MLQLLRRMLLRFFIGLAAFEFDELSTFDALRHNLPSDAEPDVNRLQLCTTKEASKCGSYHIESGPGLLHSMPVLIFFCQ